MKQVYDNLYIGDANDAGNTARRRENNIEYVLNVSHLASERQVKHYIHTPIADSGENTDFLLNTVIQTAQRLHSKAMEEDKSLLIHCSIGVSRSVSIAASLMSLENGKRVRENVNRIKKVHPAANPEPELLEQVSRLTVEKYNE